MRDLATMAGVSPMTVSYALRNHPRVSMETRDRIQALAAQVGYSVDPETSRCLSRVASRGRGIKEGIGFLHFVDNDRERDLQWLAEERAGQRGFSVEGLWLRERGLEIRRALEILESRGIRGLLVGNLHGEGEGSLPDLYQFSAVELGLTHPNSQLPRVLGNHFGNACRVLDRLFDYGYQRPGLVCLKSQDDVYQGQLRAAFSVRSPRD